jgi:hypothetical protein
MPTFDSSNDGGNRSYDGGEGSPDSYPEQAGLTLDALFFLFSEP